ncbi:ABC transporter permease [Agromyces kandeliae]|uniref:FtsX-like permease family protein n=1 Tax=Agromyces kandeliae TaxID=2666141 RepID=A0A6L5R3Z5_9MICO|nr:FtsX-like permease family protein [Agromyces kandeliae]MRX44670.1 FtsX-like permease family protein [Agromyces kandeliae]
MTPADVVGSAVANTFRSKTRTILTVLAIFIGAFTLTITTGLGTGINRYIDQTVAEIGAEDVMTVAHQAEETTDDGPREYDPDAVTASGLGADGPGGGGTIDPITDDDLVTIAAIDGVESVEPLKQVSVDYIQHDDGTRYEVSVGSFIPGMELVLASGEQPDPDAAAAQVAIPVDFVEPLGFDSQADALGSEVAFGVADATGVEHVVTVEVVGVSEAGLIGTGNSVSPNTALTDELYAAQATGAIGQTDLYGSAVVTFDPELGETATQALKDDLDEAGFTATTVEDQIGAFQSVIDGIVLVLNAFAVIALLAAGFGIVNTLLMSVQERTREIGLMKAMGMGSGRVFGLFSTEATFIGFLGSAVGVVLGMVAGTAVGDALATTMFADLPGLTLIAFDPTSVASIIVLVMAIAFLAGTIPAGRAARQDPIESLRYE